MHLSWHISLSLLLVVGMFLPRYIIKILMMMPVILTPHDRWEPVRVCSVITISILIKNILFHLHHHHLPTSSLTVLHIKREVFQGEAHGPYTLRSVIKCAVCLNPVITWKKAGNSKCLKLLESVFCFLTAAWFITNYGEAGLTLMFHDEINFGVLVGYDKIVSHGGQFSRV